MAVLGELAQRLAPPPIVSKAARAFNPEGQTLDERLATLARLLELVKEVNAEP